MSKEDLEDSEDLGDLGEILLSACTPRACRQGCLTHN